MAPRDAAALRTEEGRPITAYFVSDQFSPPTLLRRSSDGDEAFVKGAWRTTTEIVDYMAGENDFIDAVSEEQARKIAPGAFT